MKRVFLILLTVALLFCSAGTLTYAENEPERPTAQTVYACLSLDDLLHLCFYVSYEHVNYETGVYGLIVWTEDQNPEAYTYENAFGNPAARILNGQDASRSTDEETGEELFLYFHGVAAKEMADTVYVQAFAMAEDGTYVTDEVLPYSVTIYAMRKFGFVEGVPATEDEHLTELLKQLLEYGAAAQIYFDYNTDHLATDALVKPDAPVEPPTYSEGLEFTKNEGENTCSVTGIGSCTDTVIVIPPVWDGLTVTEIAAGAFCDLSSVTSVVIPGTVTRIGESAFRNCSSLANVFIPATVTRIGESAFRDCSSLTEVFIPESVILIERNAFDGCNQLSAVTFEHPEGWCASGSMSITMDFDSGKSKKNADYLSREYSTLRWSRQTEPES